MRFLRNKGRTLKKKFIDIVRGLKRNG